MDSRLKSITENLTNIIIGFPINYLANVLILPHYKDGFDTTTQTLISSAEIGIWFTIVSVVRGYGLRRLFERFGERENFYTLTVRGINFISKRFRG